MRRILHLDYETRSDIDLKKTGLHIYARGKNTDIICAGYAFDDEPVRLWKRGEPVPEEVATHILLQGEVWAHNAPFEIEITNSVGVKYGWPELKPSQTVCTAVMAYAMGLPGSLDGCSTALGIKEKKDMAGSRLMLQLSKPREILPDGTIVWWDDEERLERLYKYCIQDVIVEREAGKRMFKLSAYEKNLWILDQEINNRGITVDVPAIFQTLKILDSEKSRLNDEIRILSKGEISSIGAVAAMKNYLEFFGVSAESLDKAALIDILDRPNLHPIARKILEIRQEASKTATAKFDPMLYGAGPDSRVRGCFQFSGANTRRWAGRRIQLHNLPRPTIKQDKIVEVMKSISSGANAEVIRQKFGPPLSVIKDCIRAFLIASLGNRLIACDFSAIEARVIAWLAGQDDVLQIFKDDKDIYKVAAADIFGVSIEDVTDVQRSVGKVAILALGYQGGVGAFQQMAKGYGVKMEPAFKTLWERIDQPTREFCLKMYELNKNKFEISKEEYLASDITKLMWRRSNEKIVQYWTDVEAAAMNAIRYPGELFSAGPSGRQVSYKKAGSFLWCRLPAGGVICYPYPEIRKTVTSWGEAKDAMTYMSEDGQSREWKRFTTYGGSLVENLTQAVARDVFADSMVRLNDAGYPIVIHTHDEIVCEKPIGEGSLIFMTSVMEQVPEWAEGLPIKASGWEGQRYRK